MQTMTYQSATHTSSISTMTVCKTKQRPATLSWTLHLGRDHHTKEVITFWNKVQGAPFLTKSQTYK